jgi:hypothetical protein
MANLSLTKEELKVLKAHWCANLSYGHEGTFYYEDYDKKEKERVLREYEVAKVIDQKIRNL